MKVIYCILIATLFISCQNNQSEVKETDTTEEIVTIEKVNIEDSVDSLKVEQIFDEFKLLYSELLSFKDETEFKKFGFSVGGPYNVWLKNVEDLKDNPDTKLLLEKGVLAGELEQLGFAYVSSNGEENETTEYFNKTFSEAINSKPTENIETASGKSNYEDILRTYKLFGRWEISNSIVKDSYIYEIYKKENEYIGVIAQGNYKTEILEKNGENYFVKGNKSGEYYRIDGNMEMLLFDKDGELESMGYVAIRI